MPHLIPIKTERAKEYKVKGLPSLTVTHELDGSWNIYYPLGGCGLGSGSLDHMPSKYECKNFFDSAYEWDHLTPEELRQQHLNLES